MSPGAISLILAIVVAALAGAPEQDVKPPALQAEPLVTEWMKRLNALDDWWITVDGVEQPENVVERMTDLFAPDAMLFVGPAEHQLGTVLYSGHQGIRKWADDFARSHVQLAYRFQNQTVNEQTADLIMSTVPPWGGLAAAAEFTAFYTERQSRRRFWGPGSAFFTFNAQGKITKLRIFIPQEEVQEVLP